MEELPGQLFSEPTRLGREYWPSEKVSHHSCHVLYLCKGISIKWVFASPFLSSPFPSPHSFDDCVEDIRDWLKQMELSLKSEPVLGAESQQGAPDTTAELERMENLHKELLARRYVYVGVWGHML